MFSDSRETYTCVVDRTQNFWMLKLVIYEESLWLSNVNIVILWCNMRSPRLKLRNVSLVYFYKIFKMTLKLITIALNRTLPITHMPIFEVDVQVNEITKAYFLQFSSSVTEILLLADIKSHSLVLHCKNNTVNIT